MTSAAYDDLPDRLDRLQAAGVLEDWEATNPTGNRRVWVLELGDEAIDAVSAYPSLELDTAGAAAFAAGAEAGRACPLPRTRKPNRIRQTLQEQGWIEVPLEEDTPRERKRRRSYVFTQAYALGWKGRFSCHYDAERGTIVGHRHDVEPDLDAVDDTVEGEGAAA